MVRAFWVSVVISFVGPVLPSGTFCEMLASRVIVFWVVSYFLPYVLISDVPAGPVGPVGPVAPVSPIGP